MRKPLIKKTTYNFKPTGNYTYHQLQNLKAMQSDHNFINLFRIVLIFGRSQWPRGLRRRSMAARLLRLWVRIPPGAWMFVVSVVCCQVEVSATD